MISLITEGPGGPNSPGPSEGVAINSTGSAPAPDWLRALLDDVGYGIMILDTQLRVVFCNDSAKGVLRDAGLSTLMEVSGGSRYYESACREFRSSAALASQGQRKLILVGDQNQQFAFAFSPLRIGDSATQGAVLVTTEKRRVCEALSLWAYGRVQGLTATEIRVLEELATGHEPKSVAGRLNVSVTTIRTHIKSMLEKTDCSSMRDLLLRISRLPPIRTIPCYVAW